MRKRIELLSVMRTKVQDDLQDGEEGIGSCGFPTQRLRIYSRSGVLDDESNLYSLVQIVSLFPVLMRHIINVNISVRKAQCVLSNLSSHAV